MKTTNEVFKEVLDELGFSGYKPSQMTNSDYWLCACTAMERYAQQKVKMEYKSLNTEETANSDLGAVSSRFVSLTDLIDVIHYTIIKHRGENIIALEEIQRLEWLIKGSEQLENYSVEETELWQSIMRQRNGC